MIRKVVGLGFGCFMGRDFRLLREEVKTRASMWWFDELLRTEVVFSF